MSAIVLFQVALCAMVTFTDGFDTQAIGYVAPAIVKAFGVERTALAPVFAVGLFGLMLGALAFGPIADRVGRKPVLVFCTAFFGLCALLTTQATTVNELFYFRFITGLGLGGALPNAIAITTDLAPARLRATTVMVMFCGFSIGAAVGGFMAASLLTRYGWPAVFVAGGIGPLVVALLLVGYLPNSRTHRPERLPVAQLFESGRSSMTILLWIVFFMSLLDLYFVTNWLPTLINDSGIALDRAVLVTAIFQLGGTVGTLTLGQLFDRLPPFRVLAATYLVAAALVAAIGLVAASIDALFIVAFAPVYPADIRATGVGWALGIGRIGSIVGPLVGGLLLTLKWETHDLFFVAAVPVLAAAASAFLIDRSPAYRRGENAVVVSTSH